MVDEYWGGEIHLTYERMRSARPHVFHLPWFPALRPTYHRPFDAAVSDLCRWVRETLPEDTVTCEADGMQIRSLHTADEAVAALIRVRWC